MEGQLRSDEPKKTVAVRDVIFGSPEVILMAGPCAVEDRDTYLICARFLRELGIKVLRGGVFKPRTNPYSFSGLGKNGLQLLAEARKYLKMIIVTEVLDPRDVELVAEHADILQIGSRNMQNFSLLREVGMTGYPVLLKRGMAATFEEWVLAAEHIRAAGNDRIIMCERGIRTFETSTRNTLDLSAVPVLKEACPYPVVVDPSHAAGKRELVGALARAAVAVGADGLLIEVHPNPAQALCDGRQSLDLKDFSKLLPELRKVARAVGRLIREEDKSYSIPNEVSMKISQGVANDDY